MAASDNREYRFDYVRAAAMMLVLAIHTAQFSNILIVSGNTSVIAVRHIIDAIFLTCNPIFFMLSGKFALRKTLNTKAEYKKFYNGKVIGVLFPLVIGLIVYYAYYCVRLGIHASFVDFVWVFLRDTMTLMVWDGNHLWYAYVILWFFLVTPFLAKMVKALSSFELKILLGASFVFHILNTGMAMCGVTFAITYAIYPFAGWLTYFLLGYGYDKIFTCRKSKNLLILTGLLAFAVLMVQKFCFPETLVNQHDYSPLYILFSLGMYAFLEMYIGRDKENKVVSFLGKYSYYFYIFHMIILLLVERFFTMGEGMLRIAATLVAVYVISFVITIAVSVAFEKVLVQPIRKINSNGKKYIAMSAIAVGAFLIAFLLNIVL